MAILKRGLRGEPVRRLQEALGIDADGIFGRGTETALKAYQEAEGLAVDGIAGPDTFSHIGLYELVLLKRGTRGEMVKRLQEALGLSADGIFGGGTEKAVRAFQSENGVQADGMAGPDTLAAMDMFSEFTEEVIEASQIDEVALADAKAAAAEGALPVEDDDPSPTDKAKTALQAGMSVWRTMKRMADMS